jgi:hypothetical protein
MPDLVQQRIEGYAEFERAWLRSLGIPLECIPDKVVAVAYLAHAYKRYPESIKQLVNHFISDELLDQALGGIDNEEDEY